jgi:hypothetical protein
VPLNPRLVVPRARAPTLSRAHRRLRGGGAGGGGWWEGEGAAATPTPEIRFLMRICIQGCSTWRASIAGTIRPPALSRRAPLIRDLRDRGRALARATFPPGRDPLPRPGTLDATYFGPRFISICISIASLARGTCILSREPRVLRRLDKEQPMAREVGARYIADYISQPLTAPQNRAPLFRARGSCDWWPRGPCMQIEKSRYVRKARRKGPPPVPPRPSAATALLGPG